MRAREREDWMGLVQAERAAWHAHLTALAEEHQAERAAWQEERKLLLNAALAQTTGEFAARQAAAKKPRVLPLAEVPPEAVKDRPRVLGF